MGFTFRPAVREQVGLIVGLAGGTGSGKTFTALRLASGMAGAKRFCVIDTEAGRAKHYADQFTFDHGDLEPPFTPARYTEAIVAADKGGYPVIVVDSTSHEWAGDGGVLDMADAELDRMAGSDYQKRDACKMASWIKPKMEHKHMVQKLLQVRAHLILCFRAEPKIDMIKVEENGRKKTKIVPKESLVGKDGWIPICEKNLPFETTCYFLLLASAPGVPQPIKLQEQHRAFFPLDKHITEESGRLLAAWAAGGQQKSAPEASASRPATASLPSSSAPAPSDADADFITPDQCLDLETMCQDAGVRVEKLRAAAGVERLAQIKVADYQRALDWVRLAEEARRAAEAKRANG
jgi:hypothetical protein